MDSRGRIGPVAMVGSFLGLAMLACGLTLLYLGMREVMEIGGACAEGGPYQTRQECPDGAPEALFGGAWGGLIGAGIFALSARALGGSYTRLLLWAWPALFLSLGWNFLEYGLDPPGGTEGAVAGWLVCAVLFGLMGGIPLLFLIRPSQLRAVFWPRDREDFEAADRAVPFTGMISRSFGRAGAPGRTHAPPTALGSDAQQPTPGTYWRAEPAARVEPQPQPTTTPTTSATTPGGLWTGLPGIPTPASPTAAPPTPTPAGGGGDVVARLERLARLRQSGALDEEEYERAKRSVLGDGA